MARFYYILYSNNTKPKFLRTEESIIMTGDYIHLHHAHKNKDGMFEISEELIEDFNKLDTPKKEKCLFFRILDVVFLPVKIKTFNTIISCFFGLWVLLILIGTVAENIYFTSLAASLSLVLSIFLSDFKITRGITKNAKGLTYGILCSVILTFLYFKIDEKYIPYFLNKNNYGNTLTACSLLIIFIDKIRNKNTRNR